MKPTETMPQPACRACGEGLRPAFSGTVLGDIAVTYHRCLACDSLQLPAPHWLERAYGQQVSPDPDTSRLMRSQAVHRVVRRLRALRLLPSKHRSLDEGAGLGLLVRLLLDEGCESWGHDPYATPIVAEPFILPEWPGGSFQLITATEVIEHTEDPKAFLQGLAARLDPRGILLLTTELFDPIRIPAPETWPYLAQDYGQHITFLSAEGLRAVAAHAGLDWWASLDFAGCPCIHLLSRERPSGWTIRCLRRRHATVESKFRDDRTV